MLKRFFLIVAIFAFASTAFSDSAFDGKWTAEVARPAPAGNQSLAISFNTKEGKVTGTLSVQGGEDSPITWGMVKGDLITFKVNMAFNNAPTTFVYPGKINGDQIDFGRRPEDLSLGRLVEFSAKRAK